MTDDQLDDLNDYLQAAYRIADRLKERLAKYDKDFAKLGAKPLSQCSLTDLTRRARLVLDLNGRITKESDQPQA